LKRTISEFDFDFSSEWEFIYPPTMSRKNHVQLQAFIDGLSFVTESDKASTGALQNPHSMGHSGIGGDVTTPTFDSAPESLIVFSSRTCTRHPTIPSSGCTIHSSITCGLCGKKQIRSVCQILVVPELSRVSGQVPMTLNKQRWTHRCGWVS
jgi:hypothetical protein